MDAATRTLVRQRADNRCEYCLLRQEHCDLTHHVEHIRLAKPAVCLMQPTGELGDGLVVSDRVP